MKKLEIPVRYQFGDTAFTTKKVKVEEACPICEGNKTIKYNDKDMRCPECMGKGILSSNKFTHIVHEKPFAISSTRINVNSNGEFTVKYKGYCGFEALNRTEENLFDTVEAAQAKCDELNKEKVLVNIADVIITEHFSASHPTPAKVATKLEYYMNNNKFESDITIDENNVLQDGYITYLLCKTLNIETIRAVVRK